MLDFNTVIQDFGAFCFVVLFCCVFLLCRFKSQFIFGGRFWVESCSKSRTGTTLAHNSLSGNVVVKQCKADMLLQGQHILVTCQQSKGAAAE